jgi:hypothetical protein
MEKKKYYKSLESEPGRQAGWAAASEHVRCIADTADVTLHWNELKEVAVEA